MRNFHKNGKFESVIKKNVKFPECLGFLVCVSETPLCQNCVNTVAGTTDRYITQYTLDER